jgi:acyl-coenzyme A synthetase/AMP-(fatty) acid ligase
MLSKNCYFLFFKQEKVFNPTNLTFAIVDRLIYASLINGATIALFYGAPSGRSFGEFVRDAGVTMLGVVPTLVKHWINTQCMKGLDWSSLKVFRFSATINIVTVFVFVCLCVPFHN